MTKNLQSLARELLALAERAQEARKVVQAYRPPYCQCEQSPCIHTLNQIALAKLAEAANPAAISALCHALIDADKQLARAKIAAEHVADELHGFRSRVRREPFTHETNVYLSQLETVLRDPSQLVTMADVDAARASRSPGIPQGDSQ